MPRLLHGRAPLVAGLLTLVAALAAQILAPDAWRETWRQTAFDRVLDLDRQLRRAPARASEPPVVVVDIDRRSLAALGPWPLPRERLAEIVEAIAAARPAAVGFDLLLAAPDERSPAVLARRLARLTGRSELGALADALPDGDKRLAEALSKCPAVLGFVLGADNEGVVRPPPIATRGVPQLAGLWHAGGAVGPHQVLAEASTATGAIALPGHADGVIRRVPLLVAAGDAVLPGLALETVRIAGRGSAYLLEAEPLALTTAAVRLPLAADALLRLAPQRVEEHAARTLAAIDVLREQEQRARLAGAIVLVGSSTPEAGGLRHAAADALMPSVQIQADAAQQILRGRAPRPLPGTPAAEPALLAGLGALAIASGAAMAPLFGAAMMALALLVAWAGALALSLAADRLLDPLTPSIVALVVFAAAAVASYAQTRRRETLLRRRFEQHLAPAVVSRIVNEPGLVKLTGERREVTALFTDIEGFTAMTHRADPEALVAVLDGYFEGVAGIVIEHGGMIEKFVGDAVHALFNAPVDVADHPQRAVDCAVALNRWAANYRAQPGPAALGFGRTRIGVETGDAIVGDVGVRAKLDYTAHGDAVNLAARLEAANKELGSSICIGEAAASRCDPARLRPLGAILVRGRAEPLMVFEPWPEDAPADWRERYAEAWRLSDSMPAAAAGAFERLACERADDPAPRRLAGHFRALAREPRVS